MKPPSTYEVAMPGSDLDFITRSRFSKNVVDYSMSRSPVSSSAGLNEAKAYNRDLGIAFKGRLHGIGLDGEYFFMVGNGLGANRFIAGKDADKEVFMNRFGSYLYAVRISIHTGKPEDRENTRHSLFHLKAGGHVSWNDHPNIVLDDERTVLDLRRHSWSADLHAYIGGILKCTSMYGTGAVDDDFDNDGKTDYLYRGWELRAIADVKPDAFKIGFRYDAFTDEKYENGTEDTMHSYTIGITYLLPPSIRLQLNYKWNIFDSITYPDLSDNSLIMEGQILF